MSARGASDPVQDAGTLGPIALILKAVTWPVRESRWFAATQAAGYERGYLISGGLLLVGGLIGLLFIRPERDRLELARHALASPALQPLSG